MEINEAEQKRWIWRNWFGFSELAARDASTYERQTRKAEAPTDGSS
jgi:hypothetical protein